MLDCPYLLLITESRAVSIICGYGIPKAAVIHNRGTQRPSSAAASRILFFAMYTSPEDGQHIGSLILLGVYVLTLVAIVVGVNLKMKSR